MTHDRGGPALIGAAALLALIADILYAASHWNGSFPRAFLISLAGMAAITLIGFAARFVRPIGTGRRAVRWNQRGINIALIVVLVAFIEVGNRVGGDSAGGILGAIAGLAGGFALYTAVWLARGRS